MDPVGVTECILLANCCNCCFELFYSADLMPFGVLVAVYHATAAGDTPLHDTSLSLLPQNLLDLTDLFLNFASYLFIGTFSFQA